MDLDEIENEMQEAVVWQILNDGCKDIENLKELKKILSDASEWMEKNIKLDLFIWDVCKSMSDIRDCALKDEIDNGRLLEYYIRLIEEAEWIKDKINL